MADDRVRRVQELRRSSAASPRPGKRYAGPDPAEWEEETVTEPFCSQCDVTHDAADCPHREALS